MDQKTFKTEFVISTWSNDELRRVRHELDPARRGRRRISTLINLEIIFDVSLEKRVWTGFETGFTYVVEQYFLFTKINEIELTNWVCKRSELCKPYLWHGSVLFETMWYLKVIINSVSGWSQSTFVLQQLRTRFSTIPNLYFSTKWIVKLHFVLRVANYQRLRTTDLNPLKTIERYGHLKVFVVIRIFVTKGFPWRLGSIPTNTYVTIPKI